MDYYQVKGEYRVLSQEMSRHATVVGGFFLPINTNLPKFAFNVHTDQLSFKAAVGHQVFERHFHCADCT